MPIIMLRYIARPPRVGVTFSWTVRSSGTAIMLRRRAKCRTIGVMTSTLRSAAPNATKYNPIVCTRGAAPHRSVSELHLLREYPGLGQQPFSQLVGIRFEVVDRLQPRVYYHLGAQHARLVRAVEQPAVDGNAVHRGLDDGVPVSYTHLTLPTIYSV